jgi:hypothetical protein
MAFIEDTKQRGDNIINFLVENYPDKPVGVFLDDLEHVLIALSLSVEIDDNLKPILSSQITKGDSD